MFGKRRSWLVATGWDAQSLEYVLARYDGQRLTIVAAESRVLDTEVGPGARLAEGLAQYGVRRATVLVALPRSRVEVLPISLPPATDAELPSLVAMQVLQQVPELADNEALDFIPLNRDDAVGREVLALGPQSGVVDNVIEELQAAGLRPHAIGFRPLGLLPLLDRTGARKSERALAFCLEPKAADILLLDGGRLVMSRSVRLPQRDNPVFSSNLIGELERTAMVLHQDGESVTELQHVYGFGSGAEFDDLITALNDDTSVSATRVNPFRIVNDESTGRTCASRFAPLIGMMQGHVTNSPHPIVDFLNPRRPATRPNPWRRVAVYATAAVGLLAALGFYVFDCRIKLDEEIVELRSQLAMVEKMSTKLERRQRVTTAIANWQADDVNWLDELRDLSIRFPGPGEALVQRMTVTPVNQGNLVTLQLRIKDPSVLPLMEANLRDEYHAIKSKRVSEIPAAEEFGWQLDTSILVRPRPRESYLHYLAMQKEKAKIEDNE